MNVLRENKKDLSDQLYSILNYKAGGISTGYDMNTFVD